MNKILGLVFVFAVSLFIFAGSADAYSTSVRVEQPETPTNSNTFDLIFVTLDTDLTKTITGQCLVKKPSSGSFTTFGSGFSFANGGNSGKCAVTSSVMNESGTYQFRVEANGSTPTSKTVSVDYNTSSAPGTPVNYSKSKTDTCTYKISFKTADDSGKTSKVVLYRSSDTSFNLDSGTKANEINIGSNTEGSMTSFISSDCDKEYYFAIRAFDIYGNGSGVVGDSNITTTIVESGETTVAEPVFVEEVVEVGADELPGAEGEVEGEIDEDAEEAVLGDKTSEDGEGNIIQRFFSSIAGIFTGIIGAIMGFFNSIIEFIKSLFN